MNQGCLSATDLNCLRLCEHFLYLSFPFSPSSLQLHPPSHPFVQRPGIFHHLKTLSVFSVGVRRGERRQVKKPMNCKDKCGAVNVVP